MVPRLVAAVVLLSSASCISVTTPRFLLPAPDREWQPMLDRARQLAIGGQTVKADSLLARFAADYPTSSGAIETNYWRSLVQLQGPMGEQGTATAIPMLQAYLATRPTAHRLEAGVLLRAAARVDTLTRAAASLSTKVVVSSGDVVDANTRTADAKAAATADTKDQEAEIKRLKDELAKSKEELERIKKRLAEPPKKPPGQ